MPNAAGAGAFSFLSGLAKGFGNVYLAKKQREWDAEKENINTVRSIVTAGIESGRLDAANTKQAFDFLQQQFGGGKGKKTGGGDPGFNKLIDATFQTMGGTQAATSDAQAGDVRRAVSATADAASGGLPPIPGAEPVSPVPPSQGAGLPPVPSGAELFRTHAQDVAEERQKKTDEGWKDAGSYKKSDGTWVLLQQNGMTGETREKAAPGEPESVAKRSLGISTFPGTVSGKDAVEKFPTDVTGQKTDPAGHYRYVKQADSAEPVGIIKVEAPASEAPTKDMRQRVAEIKAGTPGMSDADAERQALLEARTKRTQGAEADRAKLANAWETFAGKKLTNEQKQRVLSGKITMKDALNVSRALWTGSGEKFSEEQVKKTADDLMTQYGSTGASAPVAIPPVPGTQGAKPPSDVTGKPSSATKPAAPSGSIPPVPGTPAAPIVDKTFGKGKKLNAAAQKTVDTARTVLDLLPKVETALKGAGVENDNSIAAMSSTRFADWLYSSGKSPAEWREDVIQYADGARAFVLAGLLQGRSNQKLQEIMNRHIPDPTKDTPLMIMRKIQNLKVIATTAAKNAAEDATMTPDQIVHIFDQLPDPKTGKAAGWDKNPFAK